MQRYFNYLSLAIGPFSISTIYLLYFSLFSNIILQYREFLPPDHAPVPIFLI